MKNKPDFKEKRKMLAEYHALLSKKHEKAVAKIRDEVFKEKLAHLQGLYSELYINYSINKGKESLGGLSYNFTSSSGNLYLLSIYHDERDVFFVEVELVTQPNLRVYINLVAFKNLSQLVQAVVDQFRQL